MNKKVTKINFTANEPLIKYLKVIKNIFYIFLENLEISAPNETKRA